MVACGIAEMKAPRRVWSTINTVLRNVTAPSHACPGKRSPNRVRDEVRGLILFEPEPNLTRPSTQAAEGGSHEETELAVRRRDRAGQYRHPRADRRRAWHWRR